LKNFYPGSGRVLIRAINPLTGVESESSEGDTDSPPDNGYHRYPVNTAETLARGRPQSSREREQDAVVSGGGELEVVMQSWVTHPRHRAGQLGWTSTRRPSAWRSSATRGR
jgi:hypothetical protein